MVCDAGAVVRGTFALRRALLARIAALRAHLRTTEHTAGIPFTDPPTHPPSHDREEVLLQLVRQQAVVQAVSVCWVGLGRAGLQLRLPQSAACVVGGVQPQHELVRQLLQHLRWGSGEAGR